MSFTIGAVPSDDDDTTQRVATLVVFEHLADLWEVADVEVVDAYRRKGIASAMYDEFEKLAGVPISSPSGWLTEDGLAFWKCRKPLSVSWQSASA